VVTIVKFKDEDEAVALANDTPYGLSSSVWSADLERADRVARRLRTGSVSINNAIATLANPALPFGGLNDSGFGRYKGAWGLHAFSNIKAIIVEKDSNRIELHWYPYSKEKFALIQKVIDIVYRGGPAMLLKLLPIKRKLDTYMNRHRL
jgi:delta 1-pyrroline-5-carboxylate dehydrogenase